MVVLNLRVYLVRRIEDTISRQVARIQARRRIRTKDKTNIGQLAINGQQIVTEKNRKAAKMIGTVIVAYVLSSLPLIFNYLAVFLYRLVGWDDASVNSVFLKEMHRRKC